MFLTCLKQKYYFFSAYNFIRQFFTLNIFQNYWFKDSIIFLKKILLWNSFTQEEHNQFLMFLFSSLFLLTKVWDSKLRQITYLGQNKYYAGKAVLLKTDLFVAFVADFYVMNSLTIANFKLPTCCHSTWNWLRDNSETVRLSLGKTILQPLLAWLEH